MNNSNSIQRNGKSYLIIKKEIINNKIVLITEESGKKTDFFTMFPEDDDKHQGTDVPKKLFGGS